MSRYKILAGGICAVLFLSGSFNYLWSQESAEAEEAKVVSNIVDPDPEGVFPSLAHKGDITEFLKLLSKASHKNIIPSPKVRGEITVNLVDVTFMEALDAVLTVNGFAYEQKGPFLYVYSAKEMEQIKAAARKMESRTYELNYIPPADVASLIAPLLSTNSMVTTSPEAGTATEGSGRWSISSISCSIWSRCSG